MQHTNSYRSYSFAAAAALIAGTIAVLTPAAAWALAPGLDPMPFFSMRLFYAIFNFIIFAGLIIYALRKLLPGFVANRRDEVRKAIDQAQEAKERAEKALTEYKEKMARIDEEMTQIRGEMKSLADRERENIVNAAKAQAEKIMADAKLVGEQEVRRAREALREEMLVLAQTLAAEQMKASLDAPRQEQQLRDFVAQLERLS